MPEILRRAVVPGALAGLVGGVVFGAAMHELGTLDSIATIARASGSVAAAFVHMAIAALVGIGFGLLVWRQRPSAGETVLWGLTYGAFFWFVGPLTLRPVFVDAPIGWNLAAAQGAFAGLIGHLLYGVAAALAFVALRRRDYAAAGHLGVSRGSLMRGGLAGVAAAALLTATVGTDHELAEAWTSQSGLPGDAAWLAALVVGLACGLVYALLYPRPVGGVGSSLTRGAAYGFLFWIVAALSVLPVLDGRGLTWSLEGAQEAFTSFPTYLFLGIGVGVLYHWLDGLVRLLFSDDVRGHASEGAGVEGLYALTRGGFAGLAGGLLFTLVMIQIDWLPRIASFVGSGSTVAAVFLHLGIATLIGASYGVLFRRQSYDLGSATGWGLTYGFCWWVLGALTLFPVFLGAEPKWDAASAANAFPSLVGHLVYGAGLGITFYLLESRSNPWWVTRTQAEAARQASRRDQMLTSAPALWALMIFIALAIPLLLAKTGEPPAPGDLYK